MASDPMQQALERLMQSRSHVAEAMLGTLCKTCWGKGYYPTVVADGEDLFEGPEAFCTCEAGSRLRALDDGVHSDDTEDLDWARCYETWENQGRDVEE